MFTKRALSARRDKYSVILQLLVPILIVLTSVWTGTASRFATDEPALRIERWGTFCMSRAEGAWLTMLLSDCFAFSISLIIKHTLT